MQTISPQRLAQLFLYECSLSGCFLVLGILFLSLFDLVFTLEFVMHGGSEANPLMALALRGGYVVFVWIKIGLTILGLMGLIMAIQSPKARYSLAFILLVYTGLFNIHAYLRF